VLVFEFLNQSYEFVIVDVVVAFKPHFDFTGVNKVNGLWIITLLIENVCCSNIQRFEFSDDRIVEFFGATPEELNLIENSSVGNS